ncbi:hypothetical protein CTA2_7465 [Colletotrichum tanaceti]|uniref:Uncharacterized protein n=1 Tax=Colletotrichum tanaceti TaxID=1306861 RepID=A0A4U6X6W1_9PEZI|nr:hypothetical protein CTA2_7465 [Colletotrichum tanaceti]TKW50844.1 hypothetical protein CTA1_12185 [Colletotrichum tanaceti]
MPSEFLGWLRASYSVGNHKPYAIQRHLEIFLNNHLQTPTADTYSFSALMTSVVRKLALTSSFKKTHHRTARPQLDRGGLNALQPGSTTDISSFMKRAEHAVASEVHHRNYRVTPEPLSFPYGATTFEIFALAFAVFAVVCVLGFMVMIAIKMRRSRAQHQFHSFPDPCDTSHRGSEISSEAFANSAKHRYKFVPGQDRNVRTNWGGSDKNVLAPKHIFRHWRESVNKKSGADCSPTGLWTDPSMDEEKPPLACNQERITSASGYGPVQFGRRSSRPFNNSDADEDSPNTHSRL